MEPLDIIAAYYPPESARYRILVDHSRLVAQKALAVARGLHHLNPDMAFIHEAAMLHDIGIFMTHAPGLDCHGDPSYICHGYLGRAILEQAGLPKHALVCERHVGVGITTEDIRKENLPLPLRDMTPQTLEEQIICYADKFYSKNGGAHPAQEKPLDKIISGLSRFGDGKAERFLEWRRRFEPCFSNSDGSVEGNDLNDS